VIVANVSKLPNIRYNQIMKKRRILLKRLGYFSKILYIIITEIIEASRKPKQQQHGHRYTQTNKNIPSKTQAPPAEINIKKLYHELALQYHPDGAVNEVDKKFRTQLFVKIKSAYDSRDIKTLQAYKLE
jgi:DnaJ domain